MIRAELERVLVRKDELPSFHEIATRGRKRSPPTAAGRPSFSCGFGMQSERNIALCPETWAAVQHIPGLKTAMFSIFEPGKHCAHRGPYNGVLRLHLGLIVPGTARQASPSASTDQVCHWQEGKVLIFDDAYEHEAWNHTDKMRVVLFVDFVKPLRFPANFVNWLLLNVAVFTPFIREGLDAHKEWEKKFYAQAEQLRNQESQLVDKSK